MLPTASTLKMLLFSRHQSLGEREMGRMEIFWYTHACLLSSRLDFEHLKWRDGARSCRLLHQLEVHSSKRCLFDLPYARRAVYKQRSNKSVAWTENYWSEKQRAIALIPVLAFTTMNWKTKAPDHGLGELVKVEESGE